MSIAETLPGENEIANNEGTSTTTVENQSPVAEPASQATATTAQPDALVQPEAPAPRRRGFAAMDRDRVKAIASKGGRAAHAAGTAHQFSADEARVAGKKGGEAPHVRRGGVRRRPTTETTPTSQRLGQGDNR